MSETSALSYEASSTAQKIDDFQSAMDKYHANPVYQRTGHVIATIIVILQGLTALRCYQSYPTIHGMQLILPLLCAIFVTDFINGLVHLYMDNNTRYHTRLGPFIAAFHMHHLKPKYTEKHPFLVYFNESGSKFWLVVYLGLLYGFQCTLTIPLEVNFGLVCIGILSSVAEVSHYWCHQGYNAHRLIRVLQKNKILLSKKHHLIHHCSDNKNYAFLNGLSDPLINWIAARWYAGYKNHSDQHAKAYQGPQTSNRI